MKKLHGILIAVMILLSLICTLYPLPGYAAEAGRNPPSQPSGGAEHTTFPLPIRENPVAAGDGCYVILADGTLIHSDFPFNRTRTLMKNAAAVYTHDEGPVVAVDRDGTLWCVYRDVWSNWLDLFRPDLPNEDGNWEKPVKLMEDVAMAAVDRFHGVILKRDGSLWIAAQKQYCKPWLEADGEEESGSPFYALVKVMDNVIWADASYYGAYAVTAAHELWGWGLSEDFDGPEKLLENVTMAAASNMAVTDNGDLLNWYYTDHYDSATSTSTRTWTGPEAILSDVDKCGRGFVIKKDGSLWVTAAASGKGRDHYWYKYGHAHQPFDYSWCEIKGDGSDLHKIQVDNAAYAAIGSGGALVLDENGTLWGIYDLNVTWNGPYRPAAPLRLMDGCFGAEGLAGDGMDNFTATQEYRPGMFSDVQETDWFADSVKSACELGLMNGYTNGTFQPNGSITLAEAVTIAARVRAVYRGEPTNFPASGLWYQPYMEYCLATQIQRINIPDYSRPATRAELASLLLGALPEDRYPAINPGIAFSDVLEDDYEAYHRFVMPMAEAGIMQGKGGGLFDPKAPVKRCEAAAMIVRCAYPELRIRAE